MRSAQLMIGNAVRVMRIATGEVEFQFQFLVTWFLSHSSDVMGLSEMA